MCTVQFGQFLIQLSICTFFIPTTACCTFVHFPFFTAGNCNTVIYRRQHKSNLVTNRGTRGLKVLAMEPPPVTLSKIQTVLTTILFPGRVVQSNIDMVDLTCTLFNFQTLWSFDCRTKGLYTLGTITGGPGTRTLGVHCRSLMCLYKALANTRSIIGMGARGGRGQTSWGYCCPTREGFSDGRSRNGDRAISRVGFLRVGFLVLVPDLYRPVRAHC